MEKHKESVDSREKVMYKYIMLSMFMLVPARLCFAASDEMSSPVQFIAHIFKLAYHGLIYYGVYRVTVEYPYAEVRKVKDFYKQLLDAAPTGIITFSSEGTINYVSKSCDNFFGYDMDKIYGITIEDFLGAMELNGSSKSELLEKLYKLKEGAVTFYGKPAFVNGQGPKLICTVMKLPMCMIIAVKDAKKAQAIENMQLQTQTILDSTDNMVFILDINGKVVMCNKKFLEITNTKSKEIIGHDLMDILDANCINKDNYKMMRNVKWNITTGDGETRKISLDSSPIFDVDNEKIGWIIIGRDISDYEKEQERIIHSEKMAVIGQMAAGLVHEIKNPLASIKGLCQLMQLKSRADKVAGYAAVMESAVDDIGEIVTNFLQFSRPATGDLAKGSINLLIHSLEMLISTNAYKHGIKTRFYYSETEEAVLISDQQIKNALLGMVDNAIDAMRGAIDPVLEVSTRHDAVNKQMYISIKDNGIGMTEEQLANLGKPFYTTKPKGTGLGVSVIKYIINEHGGSIKVDSKFGEGTTFTIVLPVMNMD
jgi:PAS domain S-box-containing protein